MVNNTLNQRTMTEAATPANDTERKDQRDGAAPGPVPEMPHGNPDPLPRMPLHPGTGLDPQDFNRANRIHVKDGSLFIDPYLVLHPRELDPANEEALRAKLNLTFSITNPSFFEDEKRQKIAEHLGSLIPISVAAREAQAALDQKKLDEQKRTGIDADLQRALDDKKRPFDAIVRDAVEEPESNPVGVEMLKNSLAIYLLAREKLTQNGYLERLSDYVKRKDNVEQVLGDLADNLGVTPIQLREAALKGGIDGVGQLLGIDPRYVADVKKLTDYAVTQDFGYNLVEHWHLGRQLLGLGTSVEDKIAAGLKTRIDEKIKEYRRKVHHTYEVATPVKATQERVAEMLTMAEPDQLKAAYALGYEFCYSPEMTADDIAFHRGIYGLHRKAANDLRDIRGTYRIFFSGKGDPEGSCETLMHEMAHNLWPAEFSAEQVAAIRQHVANDQQRFDTLNRFFQNPQKFEEFRKLHASYLVGNAEEKAAIIATANERFAADSINVDALFPALRDPFKLKNMVAYAQDQLQVEGDRFNKSGYESPQERFREVISRYAALKQVRLRGEPEMMEFIAPDLGKVWNQYYIPHLRSVYQKAIAGEVQPVPAAAPASGVQAAVEPAPITKPATPELPHPQPANENIATANDQTALPKHVVETAGLQHNATLNAAHQALASMAQR